MDDDKSFTTENIAPRLLQNLGLHVPEGSILID